MAQLKGDWQLKIVGNGPLKSHLLNKIEVLNLKSKVTILDNLADEAKHRLLAQSDIVILPSLTGAEAYGMVIAEAFSYGKPVITSNISSGVSYLARNGDCGAIVEPGNVLHLRQEVENLMNSPDRRRTLGARNFEFWQENLNRNKFMSRYDQFLKYYCRSNDADETKSRFFTRTA